jgi:uncharacterized protein (TIGR02757 family)
MKDDCTVKIRPELAEKLAGLARRYENITFLEDDPSQFMHRYSSEADIETAAFIAAMLSFGRRDQILLKVDWILQRAGSSPAAWIADGKFAEDFTVSEKKFYRFYSSTDMRVFFSELGIILRESGTLGKYFHAQYENSTGTDPASERNPFRMQTLISEAFPKSTPVPKNSLSACKRIHLFLRWMVRTGSPIDTGLWTWFSPARLIMPLDTHVIKEASRLGLLGQIPVNGGGTAKNAYRLTQTLSQIWPEDPCKGDFALFGLGVNA